MRKWILPLFLLFLSANLFGQKSGKNDITFGVLTQGEFYLFKGTRQYYLFGDYCRSHKNFFTRFRGSYYTQSFGGTINSNLGDDTSAVTYLWLEAHNVNNFQFHDRIHLQPKSGLKSFGTQLINVTKIEFDVYLGYNLKIGNQKRFHIQPSVGFAAYYFRHDIFSILLPLQFGDDIENPTITNRQTGIFNTTRGVVWGPIADISFRYYFKSRYSVGMNVIGGSNKYFNTFYYGAFIGFNF